MPESPSPTPERRTEVNVALAQHLLGYPVAPTPGIGPDEYDERRVICQRALDARQRLLENMQQAAVAADITVAPEQLAAWEPSELELAAIRKQLTPERKRARLLDGFDSFLADQRMTANALGTPLWQNQQDMLINTNNFLVRLPATTPQGGKGGVIGAPPGVGKTGGISGISAAVKYNEDPDERVKIIVLEDTINVMHQTRGEGGERGFGKFAPHLDVGLRYQDKKDLDHDIVIMPSASFNLLVENGEMPDCDVVIADEVDVYAGGKTGQNLRAYGADKIVLGFSGSVDDATRYLLPHDIYNMSLPEGIRLRRLAPTTAEVLHTESDIDESQLPLDPAERRAAIEGHRLRARIEDMKARIPALIEQGLGVVVRCPPMDDIEIAKIVAQELRDLSVTVPNDGSWPGNFQTMRRAIRALAIGGKDQATTKGRRFQQAAFKQYNSREADVFCFVRAIGRGWDSPHAKVIFDLDTGGSWRDKLQADGRVTRLAFDKQGKPVEAFIYNYYDPDRPDQYTGVLALGGQPGQNSIRVGHQNVPDVMPIPVQTAKRSPIALPDARLLGSVLAATIESLHVGHEDEPGNAESNERAEEDDSIPLTFEEAAARLGVSTILLGNIYAEYDFDRTSVITVGDLNAMIDLSYPDLRIERLPATGYIADEAVLQRSGIPNITVAQLRLRARYRGFAYQRFLQPDGRAGFYFAVDELPGLLDSLKQPFRPKQ